MTAKPFAFGARAFAAVALVAPLASCTLPPIAPAATPAPAEFERADVVRGAQLAALGSCDSCHTAPDGAAYAGGRRIATPFGAIYSTNLTPDRDTGIGRWSEQAFIRAMREGVDREGHRLYPVFPYDHFTLVDDRDLHALYAFLMTRIPTGAPHPRNELAFPLNVRPLLAAWQLLYLHPRRFEADSAQSAEWNRGKYLVDGLAHCGACHTPRNMLGAEKRDRAFTGGEAEGWTAPALDAASPAPSPWTRERIAAYLRNEPVARQGVPAGPMGLVTHDLSVVPKQDVEAIATYMASIAGARAGEAPRREEDATLQQRTADAAAASDAGLADGRAIYVSTCSACHEAGRGIDSAHAMHLANSTALSLSTPANLLRIVEDGVTPRDGERGRWMPSFRGSFSDAQLVDLSRYLRAAFGRGDAWKGIDDHVRAAREGGDSAS